MKRLLAALCLILILPLLLAQYTTYQYPDIDRLRGAPPKTREVVSPPLARVGSRTLDSLRGLG